MKSFLLILIAIFSLSLSLQASNTWGTGTSKLEYVRVQDGILMIKLIDPIAPGCNESISLALRPTDLGYDGLLALSLSALMGDRIVSVRYDTDDLIYASWCRIRTIVVR